MLVRGCVGGLKRMFEFKDIDTKLGVYYWGGGARNSKT